jgi:hypothetical protein
MRFGLCCISLILKDQGFGHQTMTFKRFYYKSILNLSNPKLSFTEKIAPVNTGSSFSYQVFVGARYMFSRSKYNFISRCGLIAEIGYFGIFAGVPYGNIGFTFKF